MKKYLRHIDLFSGIGGFSLAADRVFGNVEHIFVEFDPFCQLVLKKHWPSAYIHGDIKTFTYARSKKSRRISGEQEKTVSAARFDGKPFLLTGGFPCQPFSQAGQRRGTEDDRHLWPEMLRVIRLTKPEWVIAENVRGLLTIGGGLVFEQVCLDLESAGYEVQPLIIPAVSLNAPHRRDRVWFIAHRRQQRGSSGRDEKVEAYKAKRTPCITDAKRRGEDDADRKASVHPIGFDAQGEREQYDGSTQDRLRYRKNAGWEKDWTEVATELCRVGDGIPKRLDRNPRLKALGNAIVPAIAEEIMRSFIQ